MFFDDRLATVLRQRADSDVGKRTQFRQLLDILGAQSSSASETARDPGLLAAAWLRMDSLGGAIPAAQRAEMIREPGWRFRNPQLAAHLAEFEPEVASAALNRAQLPSEDWSALIPRLPVRARGFLRLRRDLPVDVETLLDRLGVSDRGLPSPSYHPDLTPSETPDITPDPPLDEPSTRDAMPPYDLQELAPAEDGEEQAPGELPDTPSEGTPPPSPPPDVLHTVAPLPPDPGKEGRSEISALVERIAQFKRSREGTASPTEPGEDPSMPRLPLGEEATHAPRQVTSFGFCADAAGRIEWADSDVAPSIIGARLVAPVRIGADKAQSPIARAFGRRQPLEQAEIELDGAPVIAGKWLVDAQPRFTESGHFSGYLGRFRRPSNHAAGALSAAEREGDRIRQLLHELRTPVTAVQGYAEVIQQQLFGTAPHEYRALAAAIAADAARILAGFEELDRLARLETGAAIIEPGETDLAAVIRRILNQLSGVLGPRMAGIELDEAGPVYAPVAMAEDQVEALLWRLLATLGGGCAAGEILSASLSCELGDVRLVSDLPAQLLGEEDIFAAEARPIGSAINAGLFGAGFALRLARAEACAAGGDLVRDDERLTLCLPRFKAASADDAERIAP